MTKDGRPNKGTTYDIGDGGPARADQRRVVDASFLDLVRFGIVSPADPDIVNSLKVVDQDLAVSTPNGTFWHRFSFDGYGETRTGAQWDVSDEDVDHGTLGRAWPLLAGERGEYAVAAGQSGAPYLASMAAAASGSDMIAEQVWDGRAPTGQALLPGGRRNPLGDAAAVVPRGADPARVDHPERPSRSTSNRWSQTTIWAALVQTGCLQRPQTR